LRTRNVGITRDLSRMTRFSRGGWRLWIPMLILSVLPALSCGRSRARHDLQRSEYFTEILKLEDRGWLGEDRFFEQNLLANPDPEVRRWCALALGRIGSRRALPMLYTAARSGDASVRAASAFAIGEIEDREVLAAQYLFPAQQTLSELSMLLDDPSRSVQMRAVEALGKCGSSPEAQKIARRLESLSGSGSPVDRAYADFAITALVRLKDSSAFPALEQLAGAAAPETRSRALDALRLLRDEKAEPIFVRNLDSARPEARASAARGLAMVKSDAARYLVRLLPPRDPSTGKHIPLSVRSSAMEAIGELKDSAAIPAIQAALDAEPMDERHPDQQNFAIVAANTLGEIGSAEAEPVLLPMLRSLQPVANSAVIALARILKQNPERFFEVIEKSRFRTPAAVPAWIRAMAELGGTQAAAELEGMMLGFMESPSGSNLELISAALTAMAKVNPPEFRSILSPFLVSRDPVLLRAAFSVYHPDISEREPWAPMTQAFMNLASGNESDAKVEILQRLTPWIGEAQVQRVLWTGLKDSGQSVRITSLALLRKVGIADAIEDPGPSAPSVTDLFCRELATSRKDRTVATVKTTRGTFQIELFREDAPFTVADFVLAAESGRYTGFSFDQVIPSEKIAAQNDRRGSGRTPRSEVNMRPFERGSVGLSLAEGARRGRIFIALAPQPYSDGVDTCFGRVISGMQVADRIVPGDRILDIAVKESINSLDYIRY